MMAVKENGIRTVKPFFRTPTADPNTTIGLSLVVNCCLFGSFYKAKKV